YDDCSLTGSPSAGPPGAPSAVTATAGNGSATVTFTTPSANGSPITGYTVTSNPGNIAATGSVSPIAVAGLANGTSYTFTVTATNSAGPGAPWAPSNAVTPAHVVGVPGAPTGVSAIAGTASARVSFTAPVSNGGSTITGYIVTSHPGGIVASGPTS